MKKTLLLLSLLTLITAASAEQLSPLAQMTNPPHIEFKYYGFYSVIDYTFMTNQSIIQIWILGKVGAMLLSLVR